MSNIFAPFDKLIKGFTNASGPIGMLLNVLEAMGVFEPLIEIFQGWMEILGGAFLPLTLALVDIFSAFTPIISQLAELLTPFIQKFVDLFLPIDVIIPLIQMFANVLASLSPIIDLLFQVLTPIWGLFSPIVELFFTLASPLMTIAPLLEGLTDKIEKIQPYIDAFANAINSAADLLEAGIDKIITWFRELPGRLVEGAGDAVASVGDTVTGWFTW